MIFLQLFQMYQLRVKKGNSDNHLKKILEAKDDRILGIEEDYFGEKGRGIRTTRDFQKGMQFL